MRYAFPVLIAALLIGVAAGRAHPVGQRCRDAQAIATAATASTGPTGATGPAGTTGATRPTGAVTAGSAKILTDEAASDYKALLKNAAPTCAITGIEALGAPASRTHDSRDNVPAGLAEIDQARERLTDLGLGTADWALVGLGFALLARTAMMACLARRPGPVNVASVSTASAGGGGSDTTSDGSSDNKAPADPAIAAEIRQRLGAQQLFGSPLVPGGGIPNAIATTLKDSSVPNVGWIAGLVGLLPDLVPRPGIQIDAVMRTGDQPPKQGCTFTLTDLSTGRPVQVFTAWRDTPLEAAKAATVEAIAQILDRDPLRRRTPAWARFGSQNQAALAAYLDGEDSWETDQEAALAHYCTALERDPGNLTIALKVASALEIRAAGEGVDDRRSAELTIKALKTYCRAAELWPDAIAPRYRKAVLLDACSRLDPRLLGEDPELTVLGLAVAQDERFTPPVRPLDHVRDKDTYDAYQDRAKFVLNSLVDDLGWSRNTAKWLGALGPTGRRMGTRMYFQRFVNPLNSDRRQVRTAYKMSLQCLEGGDDGTVRKLLGETHRAGFTPLQRSAVNWQVRYNAACYYALAGNFRATNDLLAEVLRDPRNGVTGEWMLRDPDLDGFRRWQGDPRTPADKTTGKENIRVFGAAGSIGLQPPTRASPGPGQPPGRSGPPHRPGRLAALVRRLCALCPRS